MKLRMFLMAVVLAAGFSALFGWKAFVGAKIRQAMAARGAPVATVSTSRAELADWQPTIRTVATLRSRQAVNVGPQLAGQITALYFESGDTVARGAALLKQFTADDEARLKAAQAERRLAELELKRQQRLVERKLAPQSELDRAQSELDRLSAEVEKLEVTIAKKTVRAPFAGRLGIRRVNLGQYIEPGDTIARLEANDRLFADFKLPQRALPRLAVGQAVKLTVDAWPGESFHGQVEAIEPAVDEDTRNLSLRAVIDNAEGRLHPGMFAAIELLLPHRASVIAVPQAALRYSPSGDSVFVVETGEDGSARARNVYVQTGATRGDLIAIVSGLSPGQQVVTAGQHKLRDGDMIRIDNSVPVASSPDPEPPES